MHDMMKKLLEKKALNGKMLPDHEKEAKMSVLHELRKHMDDMMADKVGSLKKVSVMSDSKPGLEHGLDKARELIAAGDEQPDHGEPESENELLPGEGTEDEGSLQDELSDEQSMSPEEIDAEIARLTSLKEKRKA